MLRREAEQLQREMEQQTGQGSQQGSAASAGQSASGQSQGASNSGVQQALDRLRQANDAMRRATSQADARRAADLLREATNLLSSMQQKQASGRLDSMAREAERLAGEQQDQAARMGRMAGQPGSANSSWPGQLGSGNQGQQKLTDDRQRLADGVAQLQQEMRDAARELESNHRAASSKLRDALGEMEQSDLETRIQRSADQLRRGMTPNSNSGEPEISAGLQRLGDQLHHAQKALGGDQQQDGETALDRVERLRNQIEGLTRDLGARASSQGRQQGQQDRGGQAGAQYGGGQPGLQTRAGQNGVDGVDGRLRDRVYGGGPYRFYGGVDTGNNSNQPPAVPPDTSPVPPDPEVAMQQGFRELNQLRQAVQDDPEMVREVQDLIREMQALDPRRFPGNPALVEQLHMQALSNVDKLELQLRRQADGKQSGQVRASDPLAVPSGYQDAVAEYFRRLSKEHQ
jgi:hypothetical protein